jgi:hypothetical protein
MNTLLARLLRRRPKRTLRELIEQRDMTSGSFEFRQAGRNAALDFSIGVADLGFAGQILDVMQQHRVEYHEHPPGEIHLSLADAQQMSDMSEQHSQDGFPRISRVVRDGETGKLWGHPYRVDARIRPGLAFIGYRVEQQ